MEVGEPGTFQNSRCLISLISLWLAAGITAACQVELLRCEVPAASAMSQVCERLQAIGP